MNTKPQQTATLTVPGMGSDHCAGIVRGALERTDGVADVQTNTAAHRVTVRYDGSRLDAGGLRGVVEGAGYDVAAVSDADAGSVKLTVPGMGTIGMGQAGLV